MVVTPLSENYPVNLREIDSPPGALYTKGSILPKDRKAVAIVGSRIASSYGVSTAKKFSNELAKCGITIISGLARGIDTIVHKEALAARGRTIAVLGGGLDQLYPPENSKLAEQIAENGAIVTEFPDGTKPLPNNFLERNRIIAGLSLAVVVIEGKRRSGTLSTARHAAELGREVFAVPGSINSPLSEAPLYLIDQGARVAKSPEDVLEYLESINWR